MKIKTPLLLLLLFLPIAFAQPLEVTVGTDALVYSSGENVTISGYVYARGSPVSGATVTIYVDGWEIGSYQTEVSGRYQSDPKPAGNLGVHSIRVVAQSGSSTGVGYGSYRVEERKRYTLYTDKFSYSPGENITITLKVEKEQGGTWVPSEGDSVPIKIKTENGNVLYNTTVTTPENGTVSLTYTLPGNIYGRCTVVAGNSLAVAVFEINQFNVAVETKDETGSERYIYGTSDNLTAHVLVTTQTASGDTLPVVGATINAQIRDSEGNVVVVLTSGNFTYSGNGEYVSDRVSLSGFSSGRYKLVVDVTSGGVSQKVSREFEVRTLRIDVIPLFEWGGSVVKGGEVMLGIIAVDLSEGKDMTGSQIINATIKECRDEEWRDCSGAFEYIGLTEGFERFGRILKLRAPARTGEYYLRIEVNTTKGTGIGEVSIPVQSFATKVETKDENGVWRWEFAPGQVVNITVKAINSSGSEIEINNVTLVELRDEDWNDLTATLETFTQGNSVSFHAPKSSGFYIAKLRVTTEEGEGYASAGFEVKMFHMWAETRDKNGEWKWQFSSNDEIYFYCNVYDLSWNRVSSTEYTIRLIAVDNEFTGKRYSNLKTKLLGTDASDRPIILLNLSNFSLPAGIYHAEFEIRDAETGERDRGHAWFKISNLDVEVITKKGDSYQWRFSPTDNITLEVRAKYFNGTDVPDGSNVSIEKVMFIKEGPPVPVDASSYSKSQMQQTTNGTAKLWIKSPSGFGEGSYLAIVKVVAGNVSEIREAWFEVKALEAWAEAPFIVRPGDNITITVSVKRTDGTPVENAELEIVEILDASTWVRLPTPEYNATNTTGGVGTITYNVGSDTGERSVRIRVRSPEGATADTWVWYEVKPYQVAAWLTGDSEVFSPGGNVEIMVSVYDPSGNPVDGATVSVYQLVSTDSWPWSYLDGETVTAGTTQNGIATVTFKAPATVGTYRPLLNITTDSGSFLTTNPWEMPQFEVRSLDVDVRLFNEDGIETETFAAGSRINASITIAGPTGAAINVPSLEFGYCSLGTECNPSTWNSLGSLTTVEEVNSKIFTAPLREGEYVFAVKVNNNATGTIVPVLQKRWFRVEAMDLSYWTTKPSYAPGENVTVYIEAREPGTGEIIPVNVSLLSLTNVWTGEVNNSFGDTEQQIFAEEYHIPPQSEPGDYEAELCVYFDECNETSTRIYVGFHVVSPVDIVWFWSEKPSYTPGEEVRLRVKLPQDASGTAFFDPSDYSLSIPGYWWVRDVRTDENITSLISAINVADDTGNKEKVINFTAPNRTGEYEFITNVEKGGHSREINIWFRVSANRLSIETIPPNPERKFVVGRPIVFNITMLPPQDASGLFRLKNDFTWEDVDVRNLTLINGSATVNITVNSAGNYVAVVEAGDAEEHYWFTVGAFDIEFDDRESTHEVGVDQNVTIKFYMKNMDGTNYDGDVSINVSSIRRSTDWSEVNSDVYNATVPVSDGNGEFSFAHGVSTPGEYCAEIIFSANDTSQMEHFCFVVATKQFYAWAEKWKYAVGEPITIYVFVGEPDGTPINEAKVTVDEVYYRRDWSPRNTVPETLTNTTGANGIAVLTFTILTNDTGSYDIKLSEDGGEVTYIGVDLGSYDAWIRMEDGRYEFATNEEVKAYVYVYDFDGNPVENAAVNATIYDERDNPVSVNGTLNGTTDASGVFTLTFNASLPSGHYRIEAVIDSGKARTEEWFMVQSFRVDARAVGEQSQREEVGVNETVIIKINAETFNREPLANANVTLKEVRSNRNWQVVEVEEIINESTTDNFGNAELRFNAPLQDGDYTAIVNVSYGSDYSIAYVWFKVTKYSVSLEFECASEGCRDPRTIPQDGYGLVRLTVSGSNLSSIKLCLDRIRDMFSGDEITVERCVSNTTVVNNTISVALPISPSSLELEEGEYEGIFDVYINDMLEYDDRWEWFRVGGRYEIFAWTSEPRVWSNQNATLIVEVWDTSTWEPVECTNGSIVEIRDSRDWKQVLGEGEIEQYFEGFVEHGMGPPPGNYIEFNASLPPGEYDGKVTMLCKGKSLDSWFHLSVKKLQVSILMPEVVKANRNITYWIKITDFNGNPIENANVTLRNIVDMRTWQVVRPLDLTNSTDSQGELIGKFTTPDAPGEYMLTLRVIYEENGNVTKEKIGRWFRVQGLNLTVSMKDEFYEGEKVNLTINVSDEQGNPVDASAWIEMMWMAGDEKGREEIPDVNVFGGSALVELTDMVRGPGEYMLRVDVCTPEKGCSTAVIPFLIRRFNISLELPGNGLFYNVSQTIPINITARDKDGKPIDGTAVVALFDMKFKGEDENVTPVFMNYTSLVNGNATMNISAPAAPGPYVLKVVVNDTENADTMDYAIFFKEHNGVVTNITSITVSPGELIHVNITTTQPNMAMQPFVIHIRKSGSAVPVIQLASITPESGVMDMYFSPIYMQKVGNDIYSTHVVVFARERQGNYVCFMPFAAKLSTGFEEEGMKDVGVFEYEVE